LPSLYLCSVSSLDRSFYFWNTFSIPSK
jgi:hypothetical protein